MFKFLSIPLLLIGFFTSAQNALNFDNIGGYDYVIMQNGGPIGNSNRTVEFWIKFKTAYSSSNIVQWGSSGAGKKFQIKLASGGKINVGIYGDSFDSPTGIVDSNWHHVAVTYNNSALNKFKIYSDGILVISTNLSVTVNTSSIGALKLGGGLSATIDDLRIGM